MRMIAVRERHAQRSRQARGDAVDDLHVDAGGAQVLHLLAAAAEDEGVAALQAHDVLASRAAITISFSMKAWGVLLQAAAHMPTARALRRMRHDPRLTRSSTSSSVADWMALSAFEVSSSGSPGRRRPG